ncbi:MAG TPA: protein-glutamate O-methyltransferase CheR [Rhodocyclaceae bacterium]|nr:protein-glutamate O-methyltransferase CheR [Rhodocyclaceae bacterium]HRQ48759.1 protein-glutamate O-methyltransferase CheR [Rhodocyclaceae bacterium]
MNTMTGNPAAQVALRESEFAQFRELIFRIAGISLADSKKPLVAGRLHKRLRHHGLGSYGEYFKLLAQREDELQAAVDLLTTNETHFFREEKHFHFLRQSVLTSHPKGRPFRIWSAASSSGQEAYSMAMLLSEVLGDSPWEVFGSDISTRVLEQACSGQYQMNQAHEIPTPYLKAFCLKGVGSQQGTFVIEPALRRRVSFRQINLNERLPEVGSFDVIFLRNVLIYFQPETKRAVVTRLLDKLRPGGYFVVGHSESLNGIVTGLKSVAPSVYRKP